MSRTINLQQYLQQKREQAAAREMDTAAINASAGRTEAFTKAANALGDYIKALPLTNQQNDELIALMIQQVTTAEKDAFLYGFDMGLHLGKDSTAAGE